jgi:hypothetical protein
MIFVSTEIVYMGILDAMTGWRGNGQSGPWDGTNGMASICKTVQNRSFWSTRRKFWTIKGTKRKSSPSMCRKRVVRMGWDVGTRPCMVRGR